MSESQKHGFLFEDVIKKEIFCITEKISYTNHYDIPSELNKLNDFNISIKTTCNKTICCGDYKTYINNKDKYLTIAIVYKQITNLKTIDKIYLINNEILIKLLNEKDYSKIIFLDNFIKTIPKNERPNTEITDKYKLLSKELSCKYIKFNPKVDSKIQRRLQWSFNIENITKDYNKFVSVINDNIIFGKQLKTISIISKIRK